MESRERMEKGKRMENRESVLGEVRGEGEKRESDPLIWWGACMVSFSFSSSRVPHHGDHHCKLLPSGENRDVVQADGAREIRAWNL